jgi:tRNA(Ile)-lysidine synthase
VGVPFVSERSDVPRDAQASGLSIEVQARRARQAFYDRVLHARDAHVMATAHTLSDQAETLLLRLVRGAGLRGIGGIRPRRDHLIRPLLDCRRDELRDELQQRGQPWREDATNLDTSNPRNRMRLELLPYLTQHFNPSVVEALGRTADLARADDDRLTEEAGVVGKALLHPAERGWTLDAHALTELPESLARRVARIALETAGPGSSYGFEDAELLRAVAAGRQRAAEFGALRVERFGANVVLVHRGSRPEPEAFAYDLAIPGVVERAEAGWRLEAEGPSRHTGALAIDPTGQQVVIEASGVGSRLVVRSRRPGDRLRPLGLGGMKKLQDVFVDRKVSRADRERIPVIALETGRIVWVPGHALAEEFRVTDRTNTVVILKLRSIAYPPAPGRGKQ